MGHNWGAVKQESKGMAGYRQCMNCGLPWGLSLQIQKDAPCLGTNVPLEALREFVKGQTLQIHLLVENEEISIDDPRHCYNMRWQDRLVGSSFQGINTRMEEISDIVAVRLWDSWSDNLEIRTEDNILYIARVGSGNECLVPRSLTLPSDTLILVPVPAVPS